MRRVTGYAIVFFAWIILCGFQQGASSENGKTNQQTTSNAQQNTGSNNQENGKTGASQPTASPNDSSKADEPNSWDSDWVWGPLRANWPLVAVGILGIWAAIKTLKAIEKQADAMMDADCALFLVCWRDMIHQNPEAPSGTLSHAFSWWFQNVGKSPGFLISAFARFIVIESLEKLPPSPDYTIPKDLKLGYDSEPIVAGQRHQPGYFAPIESKLSYEELEALERARKCSFYAYGRLRYTDIYGRNQESRFGVIWKYYPDRPARGRFEIAGPRSYNHYKNPRKKWWQFFSRN